MPGLNSTRSRTIEEFKHKLLDGGARPSLFEMKVFWPLSLSSILGGDAAAAGSLPFHCKMSEIPSSQITPITVKYQGREVKYAGQRTFTNLTITILNDENFTVRKSLETWIDNINTAVTNRSEFNQASPIAGGGYAGTGIVTQYDKQGTAVRAYRFIDMYPITLSNIQLSWESDGQLEEYTCEFAYQHWVADPLVFRV